MSIEEIVQLLKRHNIKYKLFKTTLGKDFIWKIQTDCGVYLEQLAHYSDSSIQREVSFFTVEPDYWTVHVYEGVDDEVRVGPITWKEMPCDDIT